MAKYTTEVRSICENYAGLNESVGYDSVDEVIEKSRTKIFDFKYPIFDESYRKVLETKILLHYYTREICEETVGLWKLRLKSKMNEIMPYYNQLYQSELIKFNPLYDTDYYKEGNRNEDNDNTTTNDLLRNEQQTASDSRETENETGGRDLRSFSGSTGGRDILAKESELGGTDTLTSSTEKGGEDTTEYHNRDKYSEWNLYSDTPQGGIEGIQGAEDEPSLLDNGYLTNARHILHDGDGTTGTSTTEFGGTTDKEDVTEYGKTESETNTTTYGKTETQSDTTNYGKTETESETLNHNQTNTVSNTGNVVFNGNTTEEYGEHVFGKMPGKTLSKLLIEFRETFLNIDLDVINDLRNLFFNLW